MNLTLNSVLPAISVALQFIIFFMLKKHEPELTKKYYLNGSIYSTLSDQSFKAQVKALWFYYNPINWKAIKPLHIKLTLMLNFIIFVYIIYDVMLKPSLNS
ncbi:hypothetical protein LP316_14960 [Thalassotalea sp. LPB0316]|uniref:hypothetical protein n=1 Tax=Thalassotalea sp. LPB0316 TaxID=2769490 RepID=UPI00186908D3|nr:hypothetical protein [Thalassotalea sp. LPB0316]QOL25574.1 hypothetical protein LP316_14960 [Thalassotalea sp. LPB0316]